MKKEYISSSAVQTKKLGRALAGKILKTKLGKKAFIIDLEGELGSGKTAFLQGFAKGLGVKENITSPTFVILKRFRINSPGSSLCVRKNSSSKFKNFYHIDCYRIKGVKEIINLGLKEIIAEPKNIVAIEWAERVGRIMPKNSVRIKFNFIDEKRRIIFRNF